MEYRGGVEQRQMVQAICRPMTGEGSDHHITKRRPVTGERGDHHVAQQKYPPTKRARLRSRPASPANVNVQTKMPESSPVTNNHPMGVAKMTVHTEARSGARDTVTPGIPNPR